MKLYASYARLRTQAAAPALHHSESFIFLLLTGVSLFFIWTVPAYVTMDGPAHLYNASLFSYFDSSEWLQEYYRKNSLLIPNVLSHWLLVFFLKTWPPLVAEKVLLSIIAVFLPLSFRWSVTAVAGPRHTMMAFLIFPLLFSNLLHHGFYNFCLAFVFFNFTIGLLCHLVRNERPAPVTGGLFILSSLALVFCHAFVFAAAMFFCFCFTALLSKGNFVKPFFRITLLLAPALFVLLHFLITVTIPHYDYDLDASAKWQSLISFGPGVVFDPKNETGAACLIFIMLLVSITFSFSRRSRETGLWRGTDVFFIFAAFLLYLIFHTTDGMAGGMFVQRLFYLFFYLLTWWLACQDQLPRFFYLSVAGVVLYSFISLGVERKKVMLAVAPEISAILKASEFIGDRSLVLVVNNSTGWFRAHFSNYLGLNKEVVLSENYEAVLDWFPLHWKIDPAEITFAKDKPAEADYFFIYTNPRAPENADEEALSIMNQSELLYEASDGSCALYKISR